MPETTEIWIGDRRPEHAASKDRLLGRTARLAVELVRRAGPIRGQKRTSGFSGSMSAAGPPHWECDTSGWSDGLVGPRPAVVVELREGGIEAAPNVRRSCRQSYKARRSNWSLFRSRDLQQHGVALGVDIRAVARTRQLDGAFAAEVRELGCAAAVALHAAPMQRCVIGEHPLTR
jgi:hypothetical protein